MFFFFFNHRDEFYKVLERPEIKRIADSNDFYFQKAADKFDELRQMDTNDVDLTSLINAAKQKPFSFERLLASYNETSAEYKLLFLIGQVISYFDSHAAMKNMLNEYDDKRVIARSGVRQNVWIESLLRFKAGADVNMLPGNIRNTILYILNPENHLNIVSDERKKIIINSLFENSDGNLFEEFHNMGIHAKNPLNNGVLYTWILHNESIRRLWDKPVNQIVYWLGGASYGEEGLDLSQKFVNNGIYAIGFEPNDISDIVSESLKLNDWIDNISNDAAKKAFELFVQMKAGDRIAIKAAYAKGKSSILRIKAIGTILEGVANGYHFDPEFGHTIPVEWETIQYTDYELGGYWRTIHRITKKQDIEMIFCDKKQYLQDEFIEWMRRQSKSNGNQYNEKTINSYTSALKNNCRNLTDIDISQPDLFYQVNAEEFKELMTLIESSSFYKQINETGNNRFSASIHAYEKFLSDRENNNARDSEIVLNENDDTVMLTLNCLGGLKQKHNILTRAPLYELNNGQKVLIRTSKLLSTGYFYGLQKPILDLDIKIDYLVLTRGNEGFYKVPFGIVRKLCWDGFFSLAAKNETEEGYRIHLNANNGIYELKFPGDKLPMNVEKYYTKFIYNQNDFISEVYMTDKKYQEVIELLARKKNIILQGAPGVGKSFLAKRLAYSVIGLKDASKVEMVQFHQSYSYEDFIEGYRPDGNGGFVLKKGVFYNFCERARNNEGNFYFIIDEINRGNLSKIMGELMLLIEHDKRGEGFAVPLTYSGELFYVPENVHIIGMMNTADRSLAMIDYALRRRFSFVPIEPAFKNPEFIKYIKKDDAKLGEKILSEMNALNVDIKNDLGTGFQIGHSYFCNCEKIDESWYKSVLRYEILPLLDEYWFDNEKQLSKWVEGLLSDEKNPD